MPMSELVGELSLADPKSVISVGFALRYPRKHFEQHNIMNQFSHLNPFLPEYVKKSSFVDSLTNFHDKTNTSILTESAPRDLRK